MDEKNHNLLTTNHKIIDQHKISHNGINPHTVNINDIDYNPNKHGDKNSELLSKQSFISQSHDIKEMKKQHKVKLTIEEQHLFGSYDWKHLPDKKISKKIRLYNKKLNKKNKIPFRIFTKRCINKKVNKWNK